MRPYGRVKQRLGNVVDIDGKGEAADIVTIRPVGEMSRPSLIDVEFYHCKYSQ